MTQMRFPIRICSPDKDMTIATGYLHQIYQTPMLQAFFKRMRKAKLTYYLLSRKYGLCYSEDLTSPYPDSEENTDAKLEANLQHQFLELSVKPKLVYWNHRPMTHQKWVAMLRRVGFDVVEATTLDQVISYAENYRRSLLGSDRSTAIEPV